MKRSLREVLGGAEAVCLDVDSTVTMGEGIDDLAAHAGRAQQVALLTQQAMGGSVGFREALRQRLDIIRPSRQLVESLLLKNPPQLTPGVDTFIDKLQRRGKAVYLVSGGFREMIRPIADKLHIPSDTNVFANRLLFDDGTESGQFLGFDESEPTSESGGKRKVLELLKRKYGYKRMVMIGDGVTDLEARPPAEVVIGFGGNVVREKVVADADFFVYSFGDLIRELGEDGEEEEGNGCNSNCSNSEEAKKEKKVESG